MNELDTLLEGPDRWNAARRILRELAEKADEWAGIPMPIADETLVIEASFPFAKVMEQMRGEKTPEPAMVDIEPRGSFWSSHRRAEVMTWLRDGKLEWGVASGPHHFENDLRTLGCSVAWGIAQEVRALELLSTLLTPHRFNQYVLTGSFIESSRRSHVSYVFRRLRPTVALVRHEAGLKILCALCLHPIGYYKGSWAGAMTPTDDVIAHLMLMRGDEHLFWRRANQHPAYRPEAGL